MLKIDDALNLAPEPETTYWLGDPAIDVEASDVARWCATGDTAALVVRPGQNPSEIVFRGLDEVELVKLRSVDDAQLRVHAAAAIGIVSIDDTTLHRDHVPIVGVRYLAPSVQRQLQVLRASLSIRPALVAWSQAEYGRDVAPGFGEAVGDVGLLDWLGLQVLIRTFRSRRR